jgi:hypothetical protein
MRIEPPVKHTLFNNFTVTKEFSYYPPICQLFWTYFLNYCRFGLPRLLSCAMFQAR